MKKLNGLLMLIWVVMMISCSKNDPYIAEIKGAIQKGPFITGTSVMLNELNQNLTQTGRSFTTMIESDNGNYNFGEMTLESKFGLLTASGYYYNEVFGTLSTGAITLQGLVDLTKEGNLNVNTMTHVVKNRIEILVNGGMDFEDAKIQAEQEFLTFLNVDSEVQSGFEDLDIASSGSGAAALLAFSVMLNLKDPAHWQENTAALSELLNRIRTDFSSDGMVDDTGIIDNLMFNISKLNLPVVREQTEQRFSSLGFPVPVADFEGFVGKFQEKYADELYSNFVYPDSGLYFQSDFYLPNILSEKNIPTSGMGYSVAAICPLGKTLRIVFKIPENVTIPRGMEDGFIHIDITGGFALQSARQNSVMTYWIQLMGHGSLVIEFYENTQDAPTRVRPVSW